MGSQFLCRSKRSELFTNFFLHYHFMTLLITIDSVFLSDVRIENVAKLRILLKLLMFTIFALHKSFFARNDSLFAIKTWNASIAFLVADSAAFNTPLCLMQVHLQAHKQTLNTCISSEIQPNPSLI